MNILVIGGTRFMGRHLVEQLLEDGHHVAVATRGIHTDDFGDWIERIHFDRTQLDSVKQALYGKQYDVVYDDVAYCSNDVIHVLDVVKCDRYIQISSGSVYMPLHLDTLEKEYDPYHDCLMIGDRNDFEYGIGKRMAECAAVQRYPALPAVFVRFPYVIGIDDYTKRFLFYIEHTVKQMPMHIENLDLPLSFIDSNEAGQFLAYLCDQTLTGPINASNQGTMTIHDILAYIEKKTGIKAVLSDQGEETPYDDTEPDNMNTDLAASIGFHFRDVHTWVYAMMDEMIKQCME